MISRVANSCFWLNRYVERVEVLARLVDVNSTFQLDVEIPDAERWMPLVVVSGQQGHYLSSVEASRRDDADVARDYLVWSTENPSSILSSVGHARENARTIRETISLEMWQTINDVWLWLGGKQARRLFSSDLHEFCQHLQKQCLLFHGIAESTMLHEEPFRFMRLGTTLERVGQTARLLDVKHHSMGPDEGDVESPAEAAQWLATLRYCSGSEPFFKRRVGGFSGHSVAEFLLFDRAFPRSVRCSLERSKNLLGLIRLAGSSIGERAAACVAAMIGRLDELEGAPEGIADLHALFTWIVDSNAEACGLVHRDFFEVGPRDAAAP